MECSYTEFWCYLASTHVMSQNLEPPWKTTPNCLEAPKGSTCVTRPAIFGCFRVSVFPTHFETIIYRECQPQINQSQLFIAVVTRYPPKKLRNQTLTKKIVPYWLVVSIPLKNMSSSLGMMQFPMESHNPAMFQ
jgi:hypothetical protein